jgi:hypothetical protein
MKKAALFVLMITCMATLAQSQVLIALLVGDKLNSDKFELGLNLAGNFQNFTGMEGTKNRFSIGFGIYGTMKLSEKLSIQPELLFKDPRGAANVSPDVFGNANLDPLLANATVSAKLAYVSIPILLKYHLSPQLSLGFGPQIGILSSAKKVYVAEVYSEEDLVYKDNVKSTLNDLDFALAFNLEYKLMKKRGVHIGLRYYLGLTDIIKDNPGESVKNSVIQINLGIPLGGKSKGK